MYLVSGGIREIIEPAAALLQIPTQNIFANRLKYFYSGMYRVILKPMYSKCKNVSAIYTICIPAVKFRTIVSFRVKYSKTCLKSLHLRTMCTKWCHHSHVNAHFIFAGEFAGFDDTCPTSRSGGKCVVVEKLKKANNYKRSEQIQICIELRFHCFHVFSTG